jgi:hypothetical protein
MIEWDEAKRVRTLRERGLDFADAERIFEGRFFTRRDDRRDYGEIRYITVGSLSGRFVALVWTARAGGRRIISLRYGHEWEKERFQEYLG